jgi:hypothetical protein
MPRDGVFRGCPMVFRCVQGVYIFKIGHPGHPPSPFNGEGFAVLGVFFFKSHFQQAVYPAFYGQVVQAGSFAGNAASQARRLSEYEPSIYFIQCQ